jgi:hypothetical protein
LGVGHIERDSVDALAMLGDEVIELGGVAGGGRDKIAGVEGGLHDGAAEAAPRAGDEPGLLHNPH